MNIADTDDEETQQTQNGEFNESFNFDDMNQEIDDIDGEETESEEMNNTKLSDRIRAKRNKISSEMKHNESSDDQNEDEDEKEMIMTTKKANRVSLFSFFF